MSFRIRYASAVLAIAASIWSSADAAPEPDYDALLQRSEKRIEEGLAEYKAFLDQISSEKLALVSEINRFENELVKLQAEEQSAQRSAKTLSFDLEDLNEEIDALDTQAQYTSGVLSEYLNNFESRIHISEDQRYKDILFALRSKIEQAGNQMDARFPEYFKAIDEGLTRQEELLGGFRFEGKAITPTGGVKEGTILLIGPSAYFQANDRSESGILEFNPGTMEPGLLPLAAELRTSLGAVFETGSGSLPIDPSQGKANLLQEARGTLTQHLKKGGWVGYAILVLGFASILIAIAKFLDLRTTRITEPNNIAEIARAALINGTDEALSMIRSLKGPVSKLLATGIEFAYADTETNLEAMEAIIIKQKPRLQRFLPFLATTAAVAPLMGLLGTVVGMIKTFTLIEVFGTGDAKSLSSGISEALITTELGLIVAIPALVFHGVFSRIMRSRIAAMEEIAADFSRQLAKESVPVAK